MTAMGHVGNRDPLTSQLYTLKHKLQESAPVTAARISPNGTHLALSTSTSIKIYSLTSSTAPSPPVLICELRGHTRGISDVQFSPHNPEILASCSDDTTIKLWNVPTAKCIKTLRKHTYHATTLQFAHRGNLLVSGSSDETITIWDLISGRPLTTLAAHADPISSISITPDDSIIISASYDGLIRLFDTETYQCLKTLTTNSSHGTATSSLARMDMHAVGYVVVSPNGKYVLSLCFDGCLRLWDFVANRVVKTFVGPERTKSPETQSGAAGEDQEKASDEMEKRIDRTTTTTTKTAAITPICEKYNCEARFITYGSNALIVSGSDYSGILCWDIKSKNLVWRHRDGDRGHNDVDDNNDDTGKSSPVLTLDTFDEGRVLVSGSLDGVVHIFEMNREPPKNGSHDEGVGEVKTGGDVVNGGDSTMNGSGANEHPERDSEMNGQTSERAELADDSHDDKDYMNGVAEDT
ncbi:uncharacterized protein LODBEIA_P42490 [Lodderomyces beijingensis]|uniref:WD40 repeat-like protein n=1 Tax=Lodderomyces beijingensis TaxID=1775926 RepID=A0ABP0ZS48_9ASCO